MKPVQVKLLVTSGLIWGCTFAILGAAYMCLIFPQTKAVSDINDKLSERKEVHSRYRLANSERSRRDRRETIDMLDEKLALYVAREIALDSLPFDIYAISDMTNLNDFRSESKSIIDESFVEIQNCGYIEYTLLDLEFTASFNNFARFINALERHDPVIFIDSLSISRNKDSLNENVAKLGLSVFVRKPEGLLDSD